MFPLSIRLAALVVVIGLGASDAARAQSADLYIQQVITEVLSRHWEHKTISSGNNFPSVRLNREHRGDVLILLHEGIPLDAIRDHFGWSSAEMQVHIAELDSADVVRRNGMGRPVPTVMVMSVGDVTRHMPLPAALLAESVDLIERHLAEVRRRYAEAPGLRAIPFDRMSLLILSNVLLDNWQINTVEDTFLGADRPLRDGNRYYYSIQEDVAWDGTEAFGIYGNQYRGYGPNLLGVYGNQRSSNPMNFAGLDAETVQSLFGVTPDTLGAFKRDALAAFVRAAQGVDAMPSELRAGFEALGWDDGSVPILGSDDEQALNDMAALVAPDLIDLLKQYRAFLEEAHRASPYSSEVTFEEYFMWWYHVYYTAVTDRLIARGLIVYPETGIVSYVFASTD